MPARLTPVRRPAEHRRMPMPVGATWPPDVRTGNHERSTLVNWKRVAVGLGRVMREVVRGVGAAAVIGLLALPARW